MATKTGRLPLVVALAAGLVAVSLLVSSVFSVPFIAVLKPFTGLVVVGVVLGWGVYHVVEFNPYDY